MIAQLSNEYISCRPTKAISRIISYLFFEGKPLTTRGQWINPFLFALYKLIKVLPKLKKIEKPIFVLGMGRSGTTITGVILSMHKQIGFLNEPKAFWHSVNPLDDLIGSYSKELGRYQLTENNVSEKLKNGIHKLYAAYLGIIFSSRVLDKYPEMIFRVPFLLEIFPDAKFIFIYRNGLDTAISSTRWSDQNKDTATNETHDWWGVNDRKWKLLVEQVVSIDPLLSPLKNEISQFKSHIDKSIVEWIVTMNQGINLIDDGSINVLPIKYEDFVNNPNTTLSKIFTFCDLKNDKKVVEFAEKTLKPLKPKKEANFHPVIMPAFNQLMSKLKYY